MAGAIVLHFASEVDGRECRFLGVFLKITLWIPRSFWWWRENQILQVKAHRLVSTRCPRKIYLVSNFCSKGLPMPSKSPRSLRTIRMMNNTKDLYRKWSFRSSGVLLRMDNGFYMACSDTSNTLYNTSLEQLCVSLLQKLICASVTSLVVFRRSLFGFPADFDGGAKIKYYKSRRIRWYQRGVQEKSFWLPIFLPKVGPCQAKISRSLRVIRMMKKT